MSQVYDEKGVELFQWFDIDASRIMGKMGKDANGKTKVKRVRGLCEERGGVFEGVSLYTFSPTARTDKTHNHKAISRQQLEKLRKQEQIERAAKLAEMYETLGFADLDDEEMENRLGENGLCGLLEKPKHI